MRLFEGVSVLPWDGRDGFSAESIEGDFADTGRLAEPVRRAIGRTRAWLLARQRRDGHWAAELEGDSALESETVLLLSFLGREETPLAQGAARGLVESQLPDGGWAMHPGGEMEIGRSVKAYFALKLTGHDPSAEYMQRARRAILAHGGADAAGGLTRFYLAILGQISFEGCPEVPPELALVPKWLPVNLYALSAWSRRVAVPLSIVSALVPARKIDPKRGIRELFLKRPERWPRWPGFSRGTGRFGWERLFRVVDGAIKWCRRRGLLPLRRRALEAAEDWMLDRFDAGDGPGAVFPSIVWSLVALRALGYDEDSPEVEYCHQKLEDLAVERGPWDAVKIQPCKSPVRDTAIVLRALLAGGVGPESSAIRRAARWLLKRQIRLPGDWAETVEADPGGWCLQYENDFYPNSDDTATALVALAEQFAGRGETADGLPPELYLLDEETAVDADEPEDGPRHLDRTAAAVDRGLRWMLRMQNDDGGWGAFDRNNGRGLLCHVPFADRDALTDPSTPDVTGRVLECLGRLGRRPGDRAVDRAVEYLRRTQESDGSWFGRWGVNHIYGTHQALVGLAAVGVAADDPMMAAGANWLLTCQQPGGGWGESPDSYADPALRGQGPVTASQTAWALMGLLAAGLDDHPGVTRGVQFLVDSQEPDGTWEEPEFTVTGLPRAFYLRHRYYPIYFPLLALSRWAVTASAPLARAAAPPIRVADEDEADESPRLAVVGV